jgi:hypothetical protein
MTDLYAPPPFAASPPAGAPWGPPPAAPAPRWSRREQLAAAATAAFVMAGTGLALALTASTAVSSPGEAVQRLVSAIADDDYRTAYGLLCSDHQQEYGSSRAYTAAQADNDDNPFSYDLDLRVTDVSYDGDEGHDGFTVRTVLSQFDDSAEVDFFVVREDSHFRVCGVDGD